MAVSFFFGFDVVQRGDDGIVTPLANTDVDVYNITQDSTVGTLTTDAYGVIPTQEINAAPNDVLEFSVSGYKPVFQRTTSTDQDTANGAELSFVVDDQFIYSASTPVETEVWLVNQDNPDYPPKLLGRFLPGQTIIIPHNLAVDGNSIDLYLINRDEKGIPDALGLNEARKQSFSFGIVKNRITQGGNNRITENDNQRVTQGS